MINQKFDIQFNQAVGSVETPRVDIASFSGCTTSRMNSFGGGCC